MGKKGLGNKVQRPCQQNQETKPSKLVLLSSSLSANSRFWKTFELSGRFQRWGFEQEGVRGVSSDSTWSETFCRSVWASRGLARLLCHNLLWKIALSNSTCWSQILRSKSSSTDPTSLQILGSTEIVRSSMRIDLVNWG